MYAPPAQTPPAVIRPALPRGACAGESISRIEIHRHAPSPRTAAQRSTEAPEVEAETDPRRTRAILAYVRLAPGRPCTERDRRESERMLRAQPYLSSAQITARPEPDGRVRLRIDVVDEFPWLLSGRVTEAGVAAVRVGDARPATAGAQRQHRRRARRRLSRWRRTAIRPVRDPPPAGRRDPRGRATTARCPPTVRGVESVPECAATRGVSTRASHRRRSTRRS
jgi:hypothetical protein